MAILPWILWGLQAWVSKPKPVQKMAPLTQTKLSPIAQPPAPKQAPITPKQPVNPAIGQALWVSSKVGSDVVRPSSILKWLQQKDEDDIINFIKQEKPDATPEEFNTIATWFAEKIRSERQTQAPKQTFWDKLWVLQQWLAQTPREWFAWKVIAPLAEMGSRITWAWYAFWKTTWEEFKRVGWELKWLSQEQIQRWGKEFTAWEAGLIWLWEIAKWASNIITKTIWGAITKPEKEKLDAKMKQVAQTEWGQQVLWVLSQGMDKYEERKNSSPENMDRARKIEAIINIAEFVPALKWWQLAKKGLSNIAEGAGDIAKREAKQALWKWDLVQVATKAKLAKAPKLSKAEKNILWIIREKETDKAKQLAMSQWRLIADTRWGARKFLFWQKGGEIIPDEKIINATKVIKQQIKKPSKQPWELLKQIEELWRRKAETLKPDLQKISLDKPDIDSLNTVANELKDLTINDEVILRDLTKKERDFIQQTIEKLTKAKNLDEVWEIRKFFDDGTSTAVKTATNLSDSKLLSKQDARMQVRSKLNDIIDWVSQSKWGPNVKKQFKDMSSLFDAKENIISRAGEVSKATQWLINKKTVLWTAWALTLGKAWSNLKGGWGWE